MLEGRPGDEFLFLGEGCSRCQRRFIGEASHGDGAAVDSAEQPELLERYFKLTGGKT